MKPTKVKWIEYRLKLEKEYLASLLPVHLRNDFLESAYIAGGAIYSLYNNQEAKDFDFFIEDEELAQQIRKYFSSQTLYQSGKIRGGTYDGVSLVVTDRAITLGKYQIITQWTGTPEEVVNSFDFIHNMFYFKNNEVVSLDGTYEALDSNELKYNENRARDIASTIIRIPKFIGRGMTITNKEMAKVLNRLKLLGYSDYEEDMLKRISEIDESHFGS